ncbi:MAG: LysE family translocator [Burkholderiaceae bacterium]|nr:LysE family translocator [Sulfuritalea sp.]MCF8173634.1 LysE family translocator [Burkholderiaceae bacterium]MCF8184153.1 LysE family translocator [Polynucleobacter sp.]
MPSSELMFAFLVATVLFAFMPGPALLYAAAQTVARGRKAGLMAAFGLHIGGYLHVGAAAAGLSALFHAVPSLYLVVKAVGAGYLVWLGVRMIWRAVASGKEVVNPMATSQKTGRRAFVESVTVEVLNPKTALFFIAFLPQFVDASAAFPIWLQFLVLGTIVNVILASADLVCVYFAGTIVNKLRQSNRIARVMEGAGGGILIGLGANLAFQRS